VGARQLAGSVLLLATLALALPAAAKKIDVQGLRLYYELRGKGDALVVFDAGLGETHETWRWVSPEVARFARVFLYDRAGLGRSEAGPAPRTSERMVEELHALLAHAGLHGPYILVGHSFGGLNVQLFASRYPDQVTALVLLEPTPLDYPAREASLLTAFDRSKVATVIGASTAGVRLEHAAIATSVEQVRAARPSPQHRVTLLSSTRSDKTPAFQAAWLEMQRALARDLDVDLHLITSRSEHNLQFDAPELVVDAIRDAVEGR
jgi:pimeloyl-ACP methyl ester carboxylesterase